MGSNRARASEAARTVVQRTVDISGTDLGADSLYRRVMPHSENVRSSVDITVMTDTAITTRPLSYSKVCDTSRPRRRQLAARRTDLGAEPFIDFFVPSPVPNGFETEHVSKGRPAGVIHRLRHAGLGESRCVDVPYRDVVELPHDPVRELVQEVATIVRDPGVDVSSLPLLPRALRHGKLLGLLLEVARVLDLFASRKRCEVFQSEVNADGANNWTRFRVRSFNAHVEEPVPARVPTEIRAILDLGADRQISALEKLELAAVEVETVRGLAEVSTFDRNPAKGTLCAPPQKWPVALFARLGVLQADLVDGAGVDAKVFARAGSKVDEVETSRPFLPPPQRVFLRLVAVVPDVVHRLGLLVQQAVEGFDAVAVNRDHGGHAINWKAKKR